MPRLESLLIALSALVALAVAVLWLDSERRAWEVYLVERLLLRGKPVSIEKMQTAWDKAADQYSRFLPEKPRYAHGLLALRLAGRENLARPTHRQILQTARSVAQATLAREPANAYVWARLAYFHQTLEGPSHSVVSALRMSIYTAPAPPNLIIWRLGLAARNRVFWDANFERLLRGQMLYAWQARPDNLAQTALDFDLVPLISEILAAHDAGALDHFEHLLERHKKRR